MSNFVFLSPSISFFPFSPLCMQASDHHPHEKKEPIDSTPTFTKASAISSRKSSISKGGEKLLPPPPPPLPETKKDVNGVNESGEPHDIKPSSLLLNALFKDYGLPNSTNTLHLEDHFSREHLERIEKCVCDKGNETAFICGGFGDVHDILCHICSNARVEGQSYAMTAESFWHLCYSAHV